MTQAEYGIVALTASLVAFTNTVSNLGLPAATFRYYNEYESEAERQEVLGAGCLLAAGYALLAALVLTVLREPLQKRLLHSAPPGLVFLLAAFIVVEGTAQYGYVILRAQTRYAVYSSIVIGHAIVQVSIAAVLVYRYKLGVVGYWLGYLCGSFVAVMALVVMTRESISLGGIHGKVVRLTRFGVPLVLSALSLWSLGLVDRWLLSVIQGPSTVASYEVAYKIGALVGFVMVPFRVAWPQFGFGSMKERDARHLYATAATILACAAGCVALVVVGTSPLIGEILAPASYGSVDGIVAWVALGQVAWVLFPVLSIGIKIEERPQLVSLAALVAATCNVALNVLLIPRMGAEGAAIATTVGYGVLAVGVTYGSIVVYSIQIEWSKVCAALGITSALVALLTVSAGEVSTGWSIVLRTVTVVIGVLLLGTLLMSRVREVRVGREV